MHCSHFIVNYFVSLGYLFIIALDWKDKSIDFYNADLNVQLVLRNSVPFGKKFASSDKFNVFVSGSEINFEVIDVC